MKALLVKELRSYLSSIIGYVVIFMFLIVSGTILWILPGANNIIENGVASLQPFFHIAPFILMILIPAFTMRCFAEEYKSGTVELLSTKPISLTKIILAKYFAACLIGIFTILPSLVFYLSVYFLGEITGNIDHPSTIGGYLALILLCMTFIAIGILASSLAKNQFIALLIGIIFNFILYIGFSALAGFFSYPIDYFLLKLSMVEHFISFQRGVIDSRDLTYFISVIIITITLTNVVVSNKK